MYYASFVLELNVDDSSLDSLDKRKNSHLFLEKNTAAKCVLGNKLSGIRCLYLEWLVSINSIKMEKNCFFSWIWN
jgi:hypothetical protein